MKRLILVLTLLPSFAIAQTPSFSSAPSSDHTTIRQLINQHYHRPLPAHQCQLSAPPASNPKQPENTAYCMKPAASHSVTRHGKATRYVLYTGFAYDTREQRKNDSHAAAGLAELFVLEKTGNAWHIAQHGKSEVGAWGETPQEWQFVQVGKQNWGYQAEDGFTNGGATETGQFFIFTDNSRVATSYIPNSSDNGGMYGDCSDYTGAEKRHCKDNQVSLAAQIRFNRAAEQNGVWGIQATLSGQDRQKRYTQQPYAMPYNSRQHRHTVPKNYLTLPPNARHLV
ncbi:hypothetical protein [Kingella oralis]|jgi:hypothetical protein|uniref:hypothetical protein n=1 Tax=Kingella oralis TaxID=505 RepID=UPI0034E4A2AC